MFTTFLIGTLLVSVLVLIALLVLPGPQAKRQDTLPYIGIAVAVLFGILALAGGLAVGA